MGFRFESRRFFGFVFWIKWEIRDDIGKGMIVSKEVVVGLKVFGIVFFLLGVVVSDGFNFRFMCLFVLFWFRI